MPILDKYGRLAREALGLQGELMGGNTCARCGKEYAHYWNQREYLCPDCDAEVGRMIAPRISRVKLHAPFCLRATDLKRGARWLRMCTCGKDYTPSEYKPRG